MHSILTANTWVVSPGCELLHTFSTVRYAIMSALPDNKLERFIKMKKIYGILKGNLALSIMTLCMILSVVLLSGALLCVVMPSAIQLYFDMQGVIRPRIN